MNFDTEETAKIHAHIEPQTGDVIMTKKRVSAFTVIDPEVVLSEELISC
jgi:isochorismate hydrolase